MSTGIDKKSASANTNRGVGLYLAGESDTSSPEQPSSKRSPILLPDGSPITVFRTLQIVRIAKREDRFSANWLKREHGVGQEKQAMRLLRFLDLLGDDGSLQGDVVDCRGNLHGFEKLLRERVQRGCERAGIPANLSEDLGSQQRRWSKLRDDLLSAAPISSLKSHNVKNNIIGSFKALDEVLRHVANDNWLENRVRSPDAPPPKESGAAGGKTQADAPFRIPVPSGGEGLTACVVFEGQVRDRAAALEFLGDMLLRMAGKKDL
jgi:hypothetical protein